MNSVCERCPKQAVCLLNPGGKACIRFAKESGFDARPTMFDKIKQMSVDEMADFLSDTFCYGFSKPQLKEWLSTPCK